MVVFSRFYSSPLEVEIDLHPVDFEFQSWYRFYIAPRAP